MPLFKLKKVWDYCIYNIPFFAFVFILLYAIYFIANHSLGIFPTTIQLIFILIILFFLSGYGMTITRDRINHGYRLPKIMPKDVFVLGIKSFILLLIFLIIQAGILDLIAHHFNFPTFNLEHMLLYSRETIQMLFSHEPVDTMIFLSCSAVVFYISTFFAEMGIAKLADTNSLREAFNFKANFKSIGLFGWKNYTRDVTTIIISIVILSYLKSFPIPNFWLNSLWNTFFAFLIFATQSLGIGAVYCEIKDMENNQKE